MKNYKQDIAEGLVRQTDYLESNNVMAYVGCMVNDKGGCQAAIVGNGAGVATAVLALLGHLYEVDPEMAQKVIDAFMLKQFAAALSGGKDEVNEKG